MFLVLCELTPPYCTDCSLKEASFQLKSILPFGAACHIKNQCYLGRFRPAGDSATSRDIWVITTCGEGSPGILWVLARDDAKHPIMHPLTRAPTAQNYLTRMSVEPHSSWAALGFGTAFLINLQVSEHRHFSLLTLVLAPGNLSGLLAFHALSILNC